MTGNKKYAGIDCNEKFMKITTRTFSGWLTDDPLGEDIYLELSSDISVVGESVLKALAKSRDVSISEEDRQALDDGRVTNEWIDEKYPEQVIFDPKPCEQRHQEWIQRMMKKYKCKTKKALLQNMQYIRIEDDDEGMVFSSKYHFGMDGWGNPAIEFKIPSDSSVEVIGAAARYAIGNGRGKGSDFIRSLIFPDGQPETFEDYLKSLGLSMK